MNILDYPDNPTCSYGINQFFHQKRNDEITLDNLVTDDWKKKKILIVKSGRYQLISNKRWRRRLRLLQLHRQK